MSWDIWRSKGGNVQCSKTICWSVELQRSISIMNDCVSTQVLPNHESHTQLCASKDTLFQDCYSWGLSALCQAHPSGTPCSTAGTKRTKRLRCKPTASCEMQWCRDKAVSTYLTARYMSSVLLIQCTQQDVHNIAFSSKFSWHILLQMLRYQVRVSGESGYIRPVPNANSTPMCMFRAEGNGAFLWT